MAVASRRRHRLLAAGGFVVASIATILLLMPVMASADSGAVAPSVESLPQIRGDVAVGGSVLASAGSWSGSTPLSYAYQWEDCLTTCSTIAGATDARYVPTANDLGQRLQVIVTASNAAGSATAASRTTALVAPSAASLQAGLLSALVPRDPTLTVAIELQTGGYKLPFRARTPGRVVVDWYLGSHPGIAGPTPSLVLVASGSTRFHMAHKSEVTIKPTRRGRRLVQRSRSLSITAIATFTPVHSVRVTAAKEFKLS
jgi:hypothetical protein